MPLRRTLESPTQPKKHVSLMIVAVTAVQPSCQPFSAANAKNRLSVSLNPSRIAALTFSLSRGFSIFSAMICALRYLPDSDGARQIFLTSRTARAHAHMCSAQNSAAFFPAWPSNTA